MRGRRCCGRPSSSVRRASEWSLQFPERPGALLNFLKKLGKQFNISLFHYRNHGAAYGRVFVGLQVPADKQEQLLSYLKDLNYPYWDESENTAYQLFLR